MSVTPKYLEANGLYLGKIWGGRKRFTVWCGHCGFVWKAKVPITEPTNAICPGCNTVNQWLLLGWDRTYQRFLEARADGQ